MNTKLAYPILTPSGWAYAPPVTDHNPAFYCCHCKYLDACRVIVCERDGLALCEPVLESEWVVFAQKVPTRF